MAKINWANGISGTWTTAGDWIGGVVPGTGDTAIIAAHSPTVYTVSLATPVSVAAVLLADYHATLAVSGTLASPDIDLKSGRLELDNGTVSGTVVSEGGKLVIGGSSVLDNVTWAGALDPTFVRHPHSALTISNGLTLIGAGGTGPGSAVLAGKTTLQHVRTLDNATIQADDIIIAGSSTLTLGAGLVLESASQTSNLYVTLKARETLINDGLLQSVSVSGPATFVNNGQISGSASFSVNSVTNNGTITETAGSAVAISTQYWNDAGATAKIVLDGGTVEWSNGATLTTAALLADYAAQHVTGSGAFGFRVANLDNSSTTLNLGTGTQLGTLASTGDLSTISGGAIIDHGGQVGLDNVILTDLSYQSASATLQLGSATLTNVDLTGASTIVISAPAYGTVEFNGGTLTGVGTFSNQGGTLILNGAHVTGVNNNGSVQVSSTGGYVELGGQDLNGYSFNLDTTSLELLDGGVVGSASLTFTTGIYEETISSFASGTLGASSATTITSGSNVDIDAGGTLTTAGTIIVDGQLAIGQINPTTNVDNTGSITAQGGDVGLYGGYLDNSGSILVTDGVLQLIPSEVTNTGTLSVVDGTLALAGSLTLGSLTLYDDPTSALVVAGDLDLGGQTITPGQSGVPDFSLGISLDREAQISDGTLAITKGDTFHVFEGQNSFTNLDVALVNNGTLAVIGGCQLAGPVSGNGLITLAGNGANIQDVTQVGSGQTIALDGANQGLTFDLTGGTQWFGGKLEGFSVGDTLSFSADSVQSGKFAGKSIVVTLDGGKTFTIATTTALTGTLTANEDYLTYTSANQPIADWAAFAVAEQHASSSRADPGAFDSLQHQDCALMDWLPHHPA